MSFWQIPFVIAACSALACGNTTRDELPEPADTAPPPPPPSTVEVECDFGVEWHGEGDVLPSVTLPGDGFYALRYESPSQVYEIERHDPLGEASVVATLPAPPTTATRIFARDGSLHYARYTDWEIHHGPVAGPEHFIPTGGRRVVDVQAADLGGLFVAFRDTVVDEYFYTIYDGVDERVTEAFTWDSSVHPRPGTPPVVARLTEDGRLLAGVAGEPMLDLPANASCTPKRPYSLVALSSGNIAWAHACPFENEDVHSVIGLRTVAGKVAWKTLATPVQSVSLAEGPQGTLLAAFVVEEGELALHYLDGNLNQLGGDTMPTSHYRTGTDRVYEFPLSGMTLSQTTIGSVFTIAGQFNIPDGHIENLAYGKLCRTD